MQVKDNRTIREVVTQKGRKSIDMEDKCEFQNETEKHKTRHTREKIKDNLKT